MPHYEAVYTDSGCCLVGCDHKHTTVTAAANCISQPAGFVVAVSRKKYRQLNPSEETEFQRAMYGDKRHRRIRPPLFAEGCRPTNG